MIELSAETRSRIDRALKNRTLRAASFGAAVLLFAFGLWRATAKRPDLLDDLQWLPLAAVVALVPVTLLLMALRFMVSSRAIGSTATFPASCKVVVLGAAANMLPVPGGVMVRVAAMSRGGATLSRSVGINIDLTICWLGVSALYSAIAAAAVGNAPLAAVFSIVALGGVGLAIALLHRRIRDLRTSLALALIQTLATFVDIARVWLCFRALGLSTDILRVMGLSFASVAGSIVTIVPAGLGVREWVAALLAPVFQLAPEAAYLGSALNRVAALAVVLVLSSVLFLVQWRAPKGGVAP